MAKRKTHSASFKSTVALAAIKSDLTVAALAVKYEVHPSMVTSLKKQAMEGMSDIFSRGGRPAGDTLQEARLTELHAKIGVLTVERDILAKAFGR